ncbi:MAG: methylamine utilization protein MauE [Proteobacteria bacterium]|nr:methylamine utilization protein MauE [Pseudomonadota bacterium]MYJ94442.1 methylamine utilization protein MauE [Pseudomonadota bacterium]
MLDPVIPLVIALSLAVLWLAAAAHKLRAFDAFSAVLADYRLLPARATGSCAAAVVGVELCLGIGLLMSISRNYAFAGSALVLVLYAGAIAVNLLRGRRFIDCGCSGFAGQQPLGVWLVARNLLLALAALAAMLPVQGRALIWFDAVAVSAAVCVSAFLYAAINRLVAQGPDLARLRG